MSEHSNNLDTDHREPGADTSFVYQLDARQRAMLAEMGVRVWAPRSAGATAPPPASEPRPVAAPVPAQAVKQPSASEHPLRPQPARPAAPASVAADLGAEPDAALRALPAGIDDMDWPTLASAVAACEACGLCRGRTQAVLGAGDPQADWMVVGEAPGEHEEQQGEPFVGEEGRLLDNMLRAVGRRREGVAAQGAYIAKVLKCRPPAHRSPSTAELAQCAPYLARQVALVQPKVIIAMGRLAVLTLLQSSEPIGRLRGQVHRYQGVPVVVTYDPASLLRTPADKRKAWADLCLAMDVTDAAGRA